MVGGPISLAPGVLCVASLMNALGNLVPVVMLVSMSLSSVIGNGLECLSACVSCDVGTYALGIG